MPVHAAAWALSSLLTVSVLIRTALAIVFLSLLRQVAHGINPNRVLDRLISESHQAHHADEEKSSAPVDSETEERLRRLNAARRPDVLPPKLAPVRDLHGRVFILASGGLDTPVGLQLADALVRRGAQLILLDPRPLSHPAVLQLVHLLRSAQDGGGGDNLQDPTAEAGAVDENQLVYAEQCDLADLQSVDAFVKKWEELLRRGGGGGGGGQPLDPRTAQTDGVDASSLQAMSSPARRLDSIIFLPARPAYSLGSRRSVVSYQLKNEDNPTTTSTNPGNKSSSNGSDGDLQVETEHALALGRLHLILSLVPSLSTLPRERDIRIVNAVGPWYAAAAAIASRATPPTVQEKQKPSSDDASSPPPGFTSAELDWLGTPAQSPSRRTYKMSPWSPHMPSALTDMTWLGLSTYLQRRLDVLAGELSSSSSSSSKFAGDALTEELMASRRSRSNIRILTVSIGLERSQSLATFLPSPTYFASPSSTGPIAMLVNTIWLITRSILWLAIQPLALLFLRSATHSANEVLWAIRAPIRAGMELLPTPGVRLEGDGDGSTKASSAQLRQAEAVVPGKLHYQGNVIRAPLPPALLHEEALRALYRQEEARARSILSKAAPLPAAAS
ncbi:unnamed protein product [Tilletia caries]|uniref:Ketoreductase (KR) domain-containing protein n=1 Tax=Tilletia caries TaxID=13290 RepID=A0ABN7IHG3_9BASI|nr:unnamed protein product [Tilletia caries]CAD6899696.1 unnamed protein product [Tilletia caries]CAD7068470.1 unnamed protein product [Tilletia caries]